MTDGSSWIERQQARLDLERQHLVAAESKYRAALAELTDETASISRLAGAAHAVLARRHRIGHLESAIAKHRERSAEKWRG